MKESFLFTQRINAMMNNGTFTKSDKTLAEYLLQHPEAMDGATANTLAEQAGVSPATVVRFSRKIGFSGFLEMKKSVEYSSYIEDNNTEMELVRGDSAEEVRHKVITYSKMILDQLENSLDPEALQKAADLISSARHVVILSEGGSGTIARAAYDIFLKLAIPVRLVDDIMFQMMEISMMGPEDVLLIVVNSGRTYNVIDNAAYAKDRGLRTIGIVGQKNTPLEKYLDVELITSMFNSSYFSDFSAARLTELMTISILHSIMALTRDKKQMEKGKEIADSLERKRISDYKTD